MHLTHVLCFDTYTVNLVEAACGEYRNFGTDLTFLLLSLSSYKWERISTMES